MDFTRVAKKVMRMAAIEDTDVAAIQEMLNNHWDGDIKGEKIDKSSIHETGNWVVLFTPTTTNHIMEGHKNKSKPGSYFDPSMDVRDTAMDIIKSKPPTENSDQFANWFEVDLGRPIGFMGVAKGTPEKVKQMQTQSMDIPQAEGKRTVTFPVALGQRSPTSLATIITEKCGKLPDGREVVYVATMWPGGSSVDGVKIPRERSEFADLGLYFVIE